MKNAITDGVWPTMITPFTKDNKIDYRGVEQLINWYIENGVNGIFAVCQSSEMFFLNIKERCELIEFIIDKVNGRIPVIASGHVADSLSEQIEDIKKISSFGIDAFVLVSNRLAEENESEEVWKRNAERIMERVPGVNFGIYECPYPYKRIISPELLKWCAQTERFYFLKDTCCNTEDIIKKLNAVNGSNLKVFNANTSTLLDTLQAGAAGFSGVMANFHPDLYVWLIKNWQEEKEKARNLMMFLTITSMIECRAYPVCAKYYLGLEGLDIDLYSRVMPFENLQYSYKKEVEQIYNFTLRQRNEYINK